MQIRRRTARSNPASHRCPKTSQKPSLPQKLRHPFQTRTLLVSIGKIPRSVNQTRHCPCRQICVKVWLSCGRADNAMLSRKATPGRIPATPEIWLRGRASTVSGDGDWTLRICDQASTGESGNTIKLSSRGLAQSAARRPANQLNRFSARQSLSRNLVQR